MSVRPETLEWLTRYYALLDGGQVRQAMREFLADNCTIRFANRPPTSFVDEARRMTALVTGVQHELLSVLEGEDGALACELRITYARRDGTSVTLPGSLFATVREGRFVEQRAYVDHAPLLP